MSKGKKTIAVSVVLAKVNTYLASDNPIITPDMRIGAASALETILHLTDNYHGFNYIGWLDEGHKKWLADGKPEDKAPYLGDLTRRHYYSERRDPDGLLPDRDFPLVHQAERRALPDGQP